MLKSKVYVLMGRGTSTSLPVAAIVLMVLAIMLAGLIVSPASAALAQANPIRSLPEQVERGETFEVIVTFAAPDDGFNAIGLTDFAPAGWVAEANTAWCTPNANFVNVVGNRAEIMWFGPYPNGTVFSAAYKVTVPGGVSTGDYPLIGGKLMYYIAGNGPATELMAGECQVSVEGVVNLSLSLQGSSRPDPAGWEIPVAVKFFEPGSDPFTEPAVYEFNPTTSKDGDVAVCQVTSIIPGTYDITVISEHTLMNVKRNVAITTPGITVDMGTLLEGDWNGNLTVDWEDLGMVLLTYDKCEGVEGFDTAADFNRNGCIDWEDLGLVSINYDKASPVEVP